MTEQVAYLIGQKQAEESQRQMYIITEDNVHVFDQLILYPTFIHISFGDRNRHQVIDKRK
jgi:hypothetical protein